MAIGSANTKQVNYTAAAALLSHVIVHGLNSPYVDVCAINIQTNQVIIPASIDISNPNQVVITFVAPRQINATIQSR